MKYLNRQLENIAFNKDFGRQMRFIAGPRQCGKTCLAKNFLARHNLENNYFNWDQRKIKISYRENPLFFLAQISENLTHKSDKTWICFDEIHKIPAWKNILKDYFDTYEDKMNFIITGSARLNLFRKSGDSLVGRYFLFHLMPFALKELIKSKVAWHFNNSATIWLKKILNKNNYEQSALEHLLAFSGFPEPLIKGSKAFANKWRFDYIDHVLQEDLRPLTKVAEIENIANLFYLLPERIGSPLSLNSLREDLAVSHATIKNYLQALKLVYMVFTLKPYYKKLNRTLRKEEKVYFYDWTRAKNKGAQFENYIAVELLIIINLWNDAGLGRFELFYIRNKEKQEIDFLIVHNDKPWMLIESKLKKNPIVSHCYTFAKKLGNPPIVQLVLENKVKEILPQNTYRFSASLFFS